MKTNKKPILKRCFCFFIIFTMFVSILPINAFASLYYTDDDGEFGMLIQEIAGEKGWQLGNSTATQWQSPIDGETHYRSSGSEQEHFDDFWTWQLDFVTSKPIEEGNKLLRQNPNAHIEDGEYDGINYKVPGSNHRYFDFIITNSDSWINNFNITLGGMGINPDSEFYQEFYDDDYTFAPGGHGVLAPNPAANVTKEEVIQWLLENFPELNDAQIAALLTNINYESGFNFMNNTGDAGHAWGLFQWNDRGGGAANPYASDKLAGWCRENFGIEWDDPENGWKAQLAFAMWESYGNESSAWNAVTAAAAGNDAYAAYNAADLFCKLWERPNAAYSNRTSVEEASANFDLVKAVRQQIKDGTFQAPGANNQSNSQHSKPNGQQQNQQNKQNYHGNNNNSNTGNNSSQQNSGYSSSNNYNGNVAAVNNSKGWIGTPYVGAREEIPGVQVECTGLVARSYYGTEYDTLFRQLNNTDMGNSSWWYAGHDAESIIGKQPHSRDEYFDVIPIGQQQPGDIYVGTGSTSRYGCSDNLENYHVGIYEGNIGGEDIIVHAGSGGVTETNADYLGTLYYLRPKPEYVDQI